MQRPVSLSHPLAPAGRRRIASHMAGKWPDAVHSDITRFFLKVVNWSYLTVPCSCCWPSFRATTFQCR